MRGIEGGFRFPKSPDDMKHPDEDEAGKSADEPREGEATRKKVVEEYANSLQELIKVMRKRFDCQRF